MDRFKNELNLSHNDSAFFEDNEEDDSVGQDDLPQQITANAQDYQNGNFDNKENEANDHQLPIVENSTTSTEAHADVMIQRPDPAEEGLSNRDREAVIEWLLKKLLTLLEGHCFLQEGNILLSIGGWKKAEKYLNDNRVELSWLNVVDLKEKNDPNKELLAFLVEKVYGPRYINTRVLQSTVKFPHGPPTQSLGSKARIVYWNCEHLGADSENGAWKRQALYSQTQMLKLDMIILLETKGCDWTKDMFTKILNGYQILELPSYDKNRGIALLFRGSSKEAPAWLGYPTGFDGGCKHRDSPFKTGDQEFISIDIKLDDGVYRIVAFYHPGPEREKGNCIVNLFKLLDKEVRDPSVYSLAALGDNNIDFDKSAAARKELEKQLQVYKLAKAIPTTVPSFYKIKKNEPAKKEEKTKAGKNVGKGEKKEKKNQQTDDREPSLTHPDIFLSRRGSGGQLFHKPVDVYSWVKGILSDSMKTMLKEIRGSVYETHRKTMLDMYPETKKKKQTNHPGPGDGHLITIVELGNNLEEPFSDIFQRADSTSAGSKPAQTTPSLFCSTEDLTPDEVAKAKGYTFLCGKKCVLHEVLPFTPYKDRTVAAPEPGPNSTQSQDKPGPSSSSQAASSSAQHQPQSSAKK